MRLSCLARNGRSPGEESLTDAVAAQAIEAQPSSGQISQREAVVAPNSILGEDVADVKGPAQESRHARRRERGPSVGKGGIPTDANQSNDIAPATDHRRSREIGAAWSKQSNEGRDYLSQLDDTSFTAPIFANLFDDSDGESYTLIWSCGRTSTTD